MFKFVIRNENIKNIFAKNLKKSFVIFNYIKNKNKTIKILNYS